MRLIPACLALSFAICGASAPVWAGESSIWWPEWTISSTEDLHEVFGEEKPVSHPLSALFDANPHTTWLMNPKATLQPMYLGDNAEKFFGKTNRGLMISGKARFVNGLQIMNGDNSSLRAFAAGNRARALRVTLLDGKKRHSYLLSLKDRMGWQRVSWPRQKADKIAIEFAKVVEVGKPICASGLGLLDGEREIKWNMPQAVMFADGFEGCGATLLLNRRGQVLDGIANDMGYSDEWSKDGRFVLGLNGGEETYLWVADAKMGKIVRKIRPRTREEELDYEWVGAKQLKVAFNRPDKNGKWKTIQTKTYRF